MWHLVLLLSLSLGDSAYPEKLRKNLCHFQLKENVSNGSWLNIPISLIAEFLPPVFPRQSHTTSWTPLCLWDTSRQEGGLEGWSGRVGLPCTLPGSQADTERKGKPVEKQVRGQNDLFQMKVCGKVAGRKQLVPRRGTQGIWLGWKERQIEMTKTQTASNPVPWKEFLVTIISWCLSLLRVWLPFVILTIIVSGRKHYYYPHCADKVMGFSVVDRPAPQCIS